MGTRPLATAATAKPEENSIRTGTVASIQADGVYVVFSVGDPVRCSCFGGYAPAVGDSVVVIRQGSSWMCLGTSSSNGATQPDDGMSAMRGIQGYATSTTPITVGNSPAGILVTSPKPWIYRAGRVYEHLVFHTLQVGSGATTATPVALKMIKGNTVPAATIVEWSNIGVSPVGNGIFCSKLRCGNYTSQDISTVVSVTAISSSNSQLMTLGVPVDAGVIRFEQWDIGSTAQLTNERPIT